MRSRVISAYKFSKSGKVKQLRFGNWREICRGGTDDARVAQCLGKGSRLYNAVGIYSEEVPQPWSLFGIVNG